jgi:predicted MPP superfamily phosphohydrolase
MSRIIVISLVLLTLVSLLLLMHYYVYRRIVSLFNLAKMSWLLACFFIMALSFPLAMFLSRTVDGRLVRIFYWLAGSWFGFIFLGLALFSLLHLTEFLLKTAGIVWPGRAWGWLAMGLTISVGVYGLINAAVINITEVTIPVKRLKPPKVTIALLTDIHVGAVYGPRYLEKIVARTNGLKPDLVAIAGDLFDGSAKPDYRMVRPLEKLEAPAFFVTGNHEVYEGLDITTELVARAGVTVLRNTVVSNHGLQIAGIDAPSRETRKNPAISEISKQFNGSDPVVLLYHIPLGLEQAKAAGVDIQLSGHTHNGQLFPFTLIMPLAYKFYKGLGKVTGSNGNFYIYVSQGVGSWGPPMRIGTRSEIIKITLVPEGQ